MNNDEIKTIIIKILLIGLSSLAAALHINLGNSALPIVTDVADLIVLGYGIYRSTNMKLVPEHTTAVEVAGGPLPVGSKTAPVALKVVG